MNATNDSAMDGNDDDLREALFAGDPLRWEPLPCALILALTLAGAGCGARAIGGNRPVANEAAAHGAARATLRFDSNHGQFDAPVRYLARGRGYSLFATQDGMTLGLRRSGRGDVAAVGLRIVGARRVEPVGVSKLEGKSNYFLGADSSKWRTGVEGYARVRYPGVLPGVDLEYYGTDERRLEYDVVLAPHVDPRAIEIAFDGITGVQLEADGSAVLQLATGGAVRQPAPVAYQKAGDGASFAVASRYEKRRDGTLGFVLGRYDTSRALVIDPVLVYSTYLGGSNTEIAAGIALDAAGNAYVTGTTGSSDFPTAAPYQGVQKGFGDIFVSKLNPSGSGFVYSTYVGGSAADSANSISVDASGNAYVAGSTLSHDFPVVPSAPVGNAGGQDAFVIKLNPSGSALVYSTYIGGTADETGASVKVDASGNAYVSGTTASTDFPIQAPLQAALGGGEDAFLVKLAPAGTSFVYSTYLGGSGDDSGGQVAIDAAGNAYLAGRTSSSNFPTLLAIQTTFSGGLFGDAFITKINPAGSGLVYSTYLGGSGDDGAHAITIDAAGNAIVAGETNSANFPTASALQPTLGGSNDAFVAKLNAAGSALLYSTYLGGTSLERAFDVALDPNGNAYVVGDTSSSDFPTAAATQTFGGFDDAFVSELTPTGGSLVYSTFLGGSGLDVGESIAVDTAGNATVVGSTTSADFPTQSPLQVALGGLSDSFITKLSDSSKVPIVDISTFYCLFLPNCNPIQFNDLLDDPFPVTSSRVPGILRSRTLLGQRGTAAGAAGLRAFQYAIDMTQVSSGAGCVAELDLDFGTPASLDLDGNGTGDRFFVVPIAGSGQVAPASVQVAARTVKISIAVCPGQSSLYFGLMAPASAQVRTAVVTETRGTTHRVRANLPAHRGRRFDDREFLE